MLNEQGDARFYFATYDLLNEQGDARFYVATYDLLNEQGDARFYVATYDLLNVLGDAKNCVATDQWHIGVFCIASQKVKPRGRSNCKPRRMNSRARPVRKTG